MYSNGLKKAILLFSIIFFSSCSIFEKSIGAAPSKTDKNLALRYSITDFGRNFLGTRYRSAGRAPSTGFDCSGFTYFIFKNYNVYLSPSSSEQSTQGRKISVKDAQIGDLIFFHRSPSGGRINHVAVITENDNGHIKIMHSTSRGVVEEDLYRYAYWRSRISYAKDVLGEL
jgi:lipoprotein Spr